MMDVQSGGKASREEQREKACLSPSEACVIVLLLVWVIGAVYDIVLSLGVIYYYGIVAGSPVSLPDEFRSLVYRRFQMGWLLAVFLAPAMIWAKMRFMMMIYMVMAVAMGIFYMIMAQSSVKVTVFQMIVFLTAAPLTEWTKPLVAYLIARRLIPVSMYRDECQQV